MIGSLVAIDRLGGAPAWGLIVGSAALGGVVGGFVAYRIRPSHPVAMAFAIWTLCALPPFALVRPFPLPVVMATALLFGGSILVGNTLFDTAMQQEVRARPARAGRVDRPDALALPHAGGSSARRARSRCAIGADATLVLAGTLMCVPNFLVLMFVPEVRSVRRREAVEPEPEPALSAF